MYVYNIYCKYTIVHMHIFIYHIFMYKHDLKIYIQNENGREYQHDGGWRGWRMSLYMIEGGHIFKAERSLKFW